MSAAALRACPLTQFGFSATTCGQAWAGDPPLYFNMLPAPLASPQLAAGRGHVGCVVMAGGTSRRRPCRPACTLALKAAGAHPFRILQGFVPLLLGQQGCAAVAVEHGVAAAQVSGSDGGAPHTPCGASAWARRCMRTCWHGMPRRVDCLFPASSCACCLPGSCGACLQEPEGQPAASSPLTRDPARCTG